MAAAGCEKDGQMVPLIIFDDLDEVNRKTSTEILRSIDHFMLDVEDSEEEYIHVFVFGRPEGFASWFQDPRRDGSVKPILHEFELGGPYFSSTGDLEILADEEYTFIYGQETWDKMKQDGTAQPLIDDYVRYVANRPMLSYSVRSLTIALMIAGRAENNPNDTEEELKIFLFEELLRRANEAHKRPPITDEQYLRILEEVAVKYNNEALLDENGFFDVRASDSVPVRDDNGREIGEVLVRNVLDHSGVAYLEPASFSSPRYSFYPIWIHTHLVQLNNLRAEQGREYLACNP